MLFSHGGGGGGELILAHKFSCILENRKMRICPFRCIRHIQLFIKPFLYGHFQGFLLTYTLLDVQREIHWWMLRKPGPILYHEGSHSSTFLLPHWKERRGCDSSRTQLISVAKKLHVLILFCFLFLLVTLISVSQLKKQAHKSRSPKHRCKFFCGSKWHLVALQRHWALGENAIVCRENCHDSDIMFFFFNPRQYVI